MNTVRERVFAKINLTLSVLGAEGGYHALDSLVASVDLSDTVVIKKRKDNLIRVQMKGLPIGEIPVEKNNAYKAAKAFSERFGVGGADITVFKDIPVGAGLGGSSADAAAVLNGMSKLYEIHDESAIDELADGLGSDTKYMRRGGYARLRGRGEKIEYLDADAPLNVLLFVPNAPVSTAACFRAFDEIQKKNDFAQTTGECIKRLSLGDIEGVGALMRNDLYEAAKELNADLARVYEEAKSFSPFGTVMTGSGSCIVALFETRELCEWAKSRYNGDAKTIVVKTTSRKKTEE